MKFALATLSALIAMAHAAKVPEISADSQLGKNLISKARRLDEDEEEAMAWVSSYSVKFQGCHDIKQWNEEADGEEDVKIQTQSLIRFRLCPTDSCSATKAAGCTSGYGDYVMDMDTFMESYMEGVRQWNEVNCENYLTKQCGGCEDDGDDDNFDADYCEYDCFNDAQMYECIEENPYDDDEQEQEQFEVEQYMECQEIQPADDERRRRKLEEDEEEAGYFVGPYCGDEGGAIYLGLFSDDTCTELVTDVTFEELMGYELPYERTSLIDASCLSCIEPEVDEEDDGNDNNNGDDEDEDNILETCEMLYQSSGKCESYLPEGMVSYPNENACNYMEGIKIYRQDGIINASSARPSALATAFVVISAMAFCAMAFYVWYLRTRLGVKQNTLL